MNAGVEVGHIEQYDGFLDLVGVGDVQLFIIGLQAHSFEAFEQVHGHLVDLLRELLEHGRVDEEPNAVREEEVGVRGSQ